MAGEEIGEGKIVLSGESGDFNRAMDDAIGRIFSFQGAIGATGVLLSAMAGKALADAINAVADFETSLAEVQKVTNASDESLRKLGDSIQNISVEYGVATSQVSDFAAEAARAGIRGRDSIADFTETVVRGRIALESLGAEIAPQFARLIRFLDVSAENSSRVMNVLNELSQTLPTNADRILNAASRMAVEFRAMGLSAPEILGLAGAVSTLRESETNAARRARRLAQELMTPKTVKEIAGAFGTAGENIQRALGQAPIATILQLSQAVQNNTEAGRNLANVLDSRVMQSLRSIGGQSKNVTGAIETATKEWQAQSSISEELGIFMDTLNRQWKRFEQIVHSTAIEIGQFFRPALVSTLGLLIGLAEDFRELNEATNGAAGGLMLVTSIFFGLAIAVRAVQSIFSFTFLSTLPKAAKFIIGIVSPLTKVRLAIILLIGAVSTLFTVWRTDFLGLRGPIEKFFKILGDRIMAPVKRHLPALKKELGETVQAFRTRFRQVKNATEFLWKPALNILVSVAEMAFDIITGALQVLVDFWFTHLRAVLHFLQGEWAQGLLVYRGFIQRTFDGITAFIKKWGGRFVDALIGFVLGAADWVKETGKSLLESAFELVFNTIEGIVNSGKNLLKSAFQKVVDTIESVLNSINLGGILGTLDSIISKARKAINTVRRAFNSGGNGGGGSPSSQPGPGPEGPSSDPFAGIDPKNFMRGAPTPILQDGGFITKSGLAFLHEGEKVVPSAEAQVGHPGPAGTTIQFNGDFNIQANSRKEGREAASGFVDSLSMELKSNNMTPIK